MRSADSSLAIVAGERCLGWRGFVSFRMGVFLRYFSRFHRRFGAIVRLFFVDASRGWPLCPYREGMSACKRTPLRRRSACTSKPLLHRRPLTFLCFAKEEVSKRKATADLPFGFPLVCCKKREVNETRYAQTTFTSDPFSAAHKRLRLQRLKDKFNNNNNNNNNNNVNATIMEIDLHTVDRRWFGCCCCF